MQNKVRQEKVYELYLDDIVSGDEVKMKSCLMRNQVSP